MNIILFRGKYIKPLIELLNENGKHIFLVKYHNGSNGLIIRNTIPKISEYNQLVITKKDYRRLLVLLSIMDNPLEAFESIYCI